MTLVPGTPLEYYSESHRRWVPAVVGGVNPETGDLSLDVKPGHEFSPAEQRGKLRPRTRPSQAQLEWARAVLRDGEVRLEAEAMAFFDRHARHRVLGGEGAPRSDGQLAPAARTLRPQDLNALSEELDGTLGIGFSLGFLQRDVRATGGHTLIAEGFARAFSDLLWHVECECCQVLVTKPRPRREDPTEVYSFEQTLASGVYGPVRFAKNRATGMTHAVKVLRRSGLTPGSREELEQLDHELRHLRRLDHPNIVKLYEHFENAEGIFLVMDYCSGGQLQSMIVESRSAGRYLPESFIADVMRQVLSAIAHMHSRRVVHLDITPANIMLMPSGDAMAAAGNAAWYTQYTLAQVNEKPHVMVIDFGVAQVLRPGTAAHGATPVSIGATLAPEVWRGDITPKADVFSCGALLFELLSLEQSFECPRDYVLAVNYWHQKPKVPWKKVKHAPRDAVELCREMLQLDRHQRPEAHLCYQQCHFLQQSEPGCASVAHAAQLAPRLLRRLAEVPGRSWLHRSVSLSVARGSPANQLVTVRRLFHALDTTGTGRLEKGRVAAALELAGVPGPSAQRAADAMDLSREGKVTWTEFVAACIDLADPRYDEHLRRIFEAADGDGDDLLSQEDMAAMFATDRLCADVARDVFVEMTGREEPGARVDWATFRRHFAAPRPRGAEGVLAAACGSLDVAGAVQDGLADLMEKAHGFLERMRGSLMPAEGGGGREVEEGKLRQLKDMGFGDREKCAEALRRRRGDVRRALLEDLIAGPPGSGGDHEGADERPQLPQWWHLRF